MTEKRTSNSYETNINGHRKISKPATVKPTLFKTNTLTFIKINVRLRFKCFNSIIIALNG